MTIANADCPPVRPSQRPSLLCCVLIGSLVLSTFHHRAGAQDTHEWNDPEGGVYGTFTKWTPTPFPAPDDTAEFNLDASYLVSFIESRTVAELLIMDGDITFDGSGIFGEGDRLYTIDNVAIDLGAHLTTARVNNLERDLNLEVTDALSVQGQITILDSAIATSERAEFDSASSNFTAFVEVIGVNAEGEQSTLGVGELNLGPSTRGRIIVDGGGDITSETATLAAGDDSFAELRVRGTSADGIASTWTINSPIIPTVIGGEGRANLFIEDGGIVTSQEVIMGTDFGGEGNATVSGVDALGNPSTWSVRGFTLGAGGDFGGGASLTIEGGGFVSSGLTVIGAGEAVVTGTDAEDNPSNWITGELTVGDVRTNATLSILEAGRVASGTTYIGKQTAKGVLIVSGRGNEVPTTWTSSANVYVGGSDSAAGGIGELFVGADSAVDITGTVKIWDEGKVELVLGRFDAARIDNTSGGEFDFQSGVLQFDRFEGSLTNQGGSLAPGPDADALVINGDYTQQAGAVLDIEIGGLLPGAEHDDVDVVGIMMIDGELQLSVINNFRPSAEDVYSVLTARGLEGSFSNVATGERLPTADGGGSFVVHYGVDSAREPEQIILTDFLVALLAGDYNFNGTVDAPDYNVWRDTFGSDTILDADGNGDGVVNTPDYNVWRDNFGESLAATVPEPSAWTLWVFGLALARVRNRCRVSGVRCQGNANQLSYLSPVTRVLTPDT